MEGLCGPLQSVLSALVRRRRVAVGSAICSAGRLDSKFDDGKYRSTLAAVRPTGEGEI